MKFEDLLMQPTDEKQQQTRAALEEEVEKLKAELDGELKLSCILQHALDQGDDGPFHSCPCLSAMLPFKIQLLLAEMAVVEEEIIYLERKVDELKLSLCQEKKQTKEWELLQLRSINPKCEQRQRKQLLGKQRNRQETKNHKLQNCDAQQNYRILRNRRKASVGSTINIQSMSSSRSNGDMTADSGSHQRDHNHIHLDTESSNANPNKLSEDLLKCLIGIYVKLNQPLLESEGSAVVPKHTVSCINSKGFVSKTTFNCTAPTSSLDDNTSNINPYCILPDLDGNIRDIGPYKNFIQITRSSLDSNRVSECFQEVGKLRVLMNKLGDVDLSLLTYKQKLAFWINIYNACIMHVLHFYNMGCLPHKRNY